MERERCDACRFDGGLYDSVTLLAAVRALGPSWRSLLAGVDNADLRARPEPEVWSALEYAAHSRDITALHVFGVEQALTLDEPSLPAIADDLVDSAAVSYTEEDLDIVLDGLEHQALLLAQLADEAGSDRWARGLTIGGERIDVRRLLEHALHDSLHHVDDVERGLARLQD